VWRTPGHVSVMIQPEGERAVITGAMTHHPCQMAHPDWFARRRRPAVGAGPLDLAGDSAHAWRLGCSFAGLERDFRPHSTDRGFVNA